MNIKRVFTTFQYVKNYRCFSSRKHPFTRTWNILSNQVSELVGAKPESTFYPEHTDVVIIGGGFIGSAAAYWLKSRTADGLSVVVLEKDLTYKESRQNLTLGSLTQHFTLPENIQLSQCMTDFLGNFHEVSDNNDIQFCPSGHLILASELYAENLEKNAELLKEYGIRCELLSSSMINNRYPWINTHDVKLGCFGLEGEGHFNSWALHKGLLEKSQDLGAVYINGEVTGFELEQQKDVLMEGITPGSYERIMKVKYRTPDNEEHSIKFAAAILTCGDKSGEVAKLAGIGVGKGLLSIPLPVKKREYDIYTIEDMGKITGLNSPFVMDTSGLWLKRINLNKDLISGHLPLIDSEFQELSEDEYYENVIKPSLVNRFSYAKNAKIEKLSTEKIDCNTFDETGIIGPHPYHNNLFIAAGFGLQGCQHAPALGKALSELVIDSQYVAVDLTRLGFDRLLTNTPIVEYNMY